MADHATPQINTWFYSYQLRLKCSPVQNILDNVAYTIKSTPIFVKNSVFFFLKRASWPGICWICSHVGLVFVILLDFFFNLHYMYAYIHRCAHNWFLSIYPLCNCYYFISRLWQLALFSDILLSFIHLDAHSSCLFIFVAIYSMWLS